MDHCPLFRKKGYLFIGELPGIFLYMSFIQVSGHVHQPNFGQSKICQLNVAH